MKKVFQVLRSNFKCLNKFLKVFLSKTPFFILRSILKTVIDIGLGPRKVYIFDNFEEFKKSCKKLHNVEIDNDPKDILGLSYETHFWIENKNDLPTVIHEIVHVVDNWISDLGFKNDSELRAYAVQGIFEKYLKFMKNNKLCP